MNRETVFSPCRLYRYTLWRHWAFEFGEEHPELVQRSYVQFIGLNPSTADETKDDPTIRRCIGFAKAWGYGALCMTNLFAWRDTYPANMKKVNDPVGPDNDRWLMEIAKGAAVVVAAWGGHGTHQYRNVKVRQMFRESGMQLHYLRLTKFNHAEHPLYLPASLTPIPFKTELPAPPA